MSQIPSRPKLPYRLCIIGNNAKSVAAATALAYFGHTVHLLTLSDSPEEHIKRYVFDKPLCQQWHKSIDDGSIIYEALRKTGRIIQAVTNDEFDGYWLFLDQMPEAEQSEVLQMLNHTDIHVILSGVVELGRIHDISVGIASTHVFYMPFTFLDEASIFTATIKPKLLMVGEKSPNTARENPIIATFLAHSQQQQVHSIMVIEFARSSMMNIVASKLSLINEMARLADACQVDMLEVVEVLKLDSRIGTGFLHPSWGYGGSTLQKEVDFLKSSLASRYVSNKLVHEVDRINTDQKELIFRKLWCHFDSDITGKTVVIWGAGYKSGTGRTKNSAIHHILPLLWAYDVRTIIYDKLARTELETLYPNDSRLKFTDDAYQDLNVADALIIINWSDDKSPDIDLLSKASVPIFDAKNLLTKSNIQSLEGFYTGIGRGFM